MNPPVIRHAGLIARRMEGQWRGILIDGPSGAGKSDLALRSLDQGFRLVADDRVLLWATDRRLFGRAPETLSGLMEVRGLGVLPIEPVAFCEITLLARLATPERIPDPVSLMILGVEIPLVEVAPFDASAPAKLSRAMTAFDAADKRRI